MAVIGQTRPAVTTIRTPLFIVGVVLALLAFLLMFAFGIIFVNRTGPIGTVRLVVANQDIGARQPIPSEALTYSVIPISAAPPHPFLRAGDLAGYAAVVPIYKGEVITANVVSATADQVLPGLQSYLPIPAGYVAVTIPMSEQIGVGGYISQGDYIDVIAAMNTGLFSPVSPHMVAKTVFTNLYVIRVGPESSAPKQGQPQGVASSLTVVMSLCDAQYMYWLILNATLKYALLNYHDYSTQIPQADSTCPATSAPGNVGPVQIDSRWAMTKS
jgi:Flp pilus assembly protein CpaB